MKPSLKMEDSFVELWNGQLLTYPEMQNDAQAVVNQVKKILQTNDKAKKLGDVNIPVSKFWQKFTPQVKEALPKTDIIIGKYRFSMKKKNDHLVFSGGQGETLGAFYAAVEDNNERFRNYVMTTIEYNAAILKNIKNADSFMMEMLSSKHKKFVADIQRFFDTNKDFLNSFLDEVISGKRKFEDNPIGIANCMLLYDPKRTMVFTLTKDNISKHITDVEVKIRWKNIKKKDVMRSVMELQPKNVHEGVIDYLKSIVSYGYDKILKLFGLEPDIDIKIKW